MHAVPIWADNKFDRRDFGGSVLVCGGDFVYGWICESFRGDDITSVYLVPVRIILECWLLDLHSMSCRLVLREYVIVSCHVYLRLLLINELNVVLGLPVGIQMSDTVDSSDSVRLGLLLLDWLHVLCDLSSWLVLLVYWEYTENL